MKYTNDIHLMPTLRNYAWIYEFLTPISHIPSWYIALLSTGEAYPHPNVLNYKKYDLEIATRGKYVICNM